MYHSFLIHSSADRHLGFEKLCVPSWTITEYIGASRII